MPSIAARAPTVAVLSFLLVVPLVLFALTPGAGAATTRTLTIWNDTAHPSVPFKGFDSNPPKLFDIDGDGRMEIIAQNDNQWVYVFDSQTGAILFETTTTFPANWGARSFNGPEVAVMKQDGIVHLIVTNSASYVTSFAFHRGPSGEFAFTKEWERRANDCYSNPGMDAKPTIADLDKDGKMEIIAHTEEIGLIALHSDGSLYWKNCMGGGNSDTAVADLNLDGWPDVVVVSDGGVVAALNGRTGAWMWGYNILANYNLRSAAISVGPGIGQLDGLGGPDIVVAARDSHDTTNFTNDHAMVLALSSGGKELWHYQDPTGNPLNYCHPIIVDEDHDGVNEVYWGDWNTIGHKGGIDPQYAWAVTGPAHFYRFTNTGSLVWRTTLNTYWSNKDLALADVDGDGQQEVLANGPGPGGDGLWYLNAATGAKETFIGTSHWKVARGPVVGDLWSTGTMQYVVEVGAADTTVSGGGLLVFDTHVAYSSLWPHLPYPGFGGSPSTTPPTTTPTTTPPSTPTTTPSTTTPSTTTPPTTTTVPPGSSREAESFAVKSTGGLGSSSLASGGKYWNLWSNGYIEDTLTGDGTSGLGVVARGSSLGGIWPVMKVSVDGAVTATFNVGTTAFATYTAPALPTGSHVVRIAFTNDASSSTEDRNLHLDVVRFGGVPPTTTPTSTAPPTTTPTTSTTTPSTSTPTTSTTTPPTTTATTPTTTPAGGSFAATFSVPSGINNWWVEVKVTTDHTVAKVEAQTNGGAWVALNPTTWGTWAKSYNVPSGSSVVFRATDTNGAVAVSQPFTWP